MRGVQGASVAGLPCPQMDTPKLRVLDLFSGIGGFALGLEAAGFETVAFCEISPKCRHLLNHHWPEVPAYDDICTLTAERLRADGIAVDAICGGFPCQDISFAGKGAGLAGERSGLWREYARLIRELRPRVVIVENVSALLSRGLGDVLGDLAEIGYDAEWDCIRASDVGAPHLRNRLWIVAYARGEQHEGFGDAFRRPLAAGLPEAFALNTGLSAWDDGEAYPQHPHADSAGPHRAEVHQLGGLEPGDEQVGQPGSVGEVLADADDQRQLQSQGPVGDVRGRPGNGREDVAHAASGRERLNRAARREGRSQRQPLKPGWWAAEPNVGRVAHGISARVDRLHGLGNAVVPQIPEILGRAILAAEAEVA